MTVDNSLDLFVRKLLTHANLSDEDKSALLALPFQRRIYEAGSYIVRENDIPNVCGVLVSGFAFRQKLTVTGTRQIVALQLPGDALDLQHIRLDVADHNVQALVRSEVLLIPRMALRELGEVRPAVGGALLIAILVESAIFREWLINIGRRDSRSRVAHLLCEFALRLERQGLFDGQTYELPMTQEQFGDALGLTAVHVNRTLRALESEGYVNRSKRNVTFPDWKAMRDLCGFNPTYLHLSQQVS